MKKVYLIPETEVMSFTIETNFLNSLDLTKESVTWSWDSEDVE